MTDASFWAAVWPVVAKEDLDRPLSAPGAALVPALLLQAPPVAGLGVELWAGAALGALLPQPEGALPEPGSEAGVLPGLAEPGALGAELFPQPDDELLLGLAGAAGAEGVKELLQPELLPLDDDEDLPLLEKDDEDLPPLEEDDLLLLAWAGWLPRTRARARRRKKTHRTLRFMPGPP